MRKLWQRYHSLKFPTTMSRTFWETSYREVFPDRKGVHTTEMYTFQGLSVIGMSS